MAEYTKHQVYEKVPIAQCLERTGKKPIGSGWVITNKGDDASPNVRARLVGKEFKTNNTMAMFAATPPLEAKRLLFSRAVTRQEDGRQRKLMFVDVKKEHLSCVRRRCLH